jgi:hypothetical protein
MNRVLVNFISLFIIGAVQFASAQDAHLLLQANFDNGLVKDVTTNHNIVTHNSPSIVQGKQGMGIELNGTNQYLEISDGSDLMLNNNAGDLSVSMWFKSTASSSDASIRPLLGRRVNSSINTDYALFFQGDGYLYYGVGPTSDACAWSKYAEPSKNTWHHIVITYSSADGNSGTKQIYLDGELVQTCSFSSKNTAPETNNLLLGAFEAGTNGGIEYFKGILDEIFIYDKVLSSSEVTALFNQPASLTEAPELNASVYPNPSSDQLTVKVPAGNDVYSFKIINVLGQIVYAGNFSNTVTLETSSFKSGIYSVVISKAKSTYTTKIIKE